MAEFGSSKKGTVRVDWEKIAVNESLDEKASHRTGTKKDPEGNFS